MRKLIMNQVFLAWDRQPRVFCDKWLNKNGFQAFSWMELHQNVNDHKGHELLSASEGKPTQKPMFASAVGVCLSTSRAQFCCCTCVTLVWLL